VVDDGLPSVVIPAKAGIHFAVGEMLRGGSRFSLGLRRDDKDVATRMPLPIEAAVPYGAGSDRQHGMTTS
jgi:hypothetical protein